MSKLDMAVSIRVDATRRNVGEERLTKIVIPSIDLPTIQGKSAQTATVSLSVLVLRLTDGHHRHHRRRQRHDKVPKWLYGDFRRSRVSKNLLGQ